MPFSGAVSRALGDDLAESAYLSIENLCRQADMAPNRSNSVLYLSIGLEARNLAGANDALFTKLEHADPTVDEWATTVWTRDTDGTFLGKASPFFRHNAAWGSNDWLSAFVLSEVHMRLVAWWLTQVWRDAELAEGARHGLERWNLLIAASCARSLLEGAARLSADIPNVVELWDRLKSAGQPTVETANAFVNELGKSVFTLHYSTRLFEKRPRKTERKAASKNKEDSVQIAKSTNASTYVENWAATVDAPDVWALYVWLCDAVHPSLGSATTYCVYGLKHRSNAYRLELFERQPLPSIGADEYAAQPKVAQATAAAVAVAAEELMRDLRRVRWVIDDIALTAQLLPPAGDLEVPFIYPPPGRNSQCPCGSGRKFKRCVHRWGTPGQPPAELAL